MGIKGLTKIIQKFAPSAIRKTKIIEYTGQTLGIDANNMIYKMILAIRGSGIDIKNDGIIVTHIHSMLLKLCAFIKYNITPIFVFDGISPELKQDTIESRHQKFKELQEKYRKSVSKEDKKKYYFAHSNVTPEEIEDIEELIKTFGFTVVYAPEEADSQLAKMGLDYIVSDDLDILVFGGARILKNFTVNKTKYMQEINLEEFLKKASINQEQLVELAIMMGCDYCPTSNGIGGIKAYHIIKKYGSISKTKINLPLQFNESKKYFLNPVANPITQISKLDVNKTKLNAYLKRFKYKDSYIEKIMHCIK